MNRLVILLSLVIAAAPVARSQGVPVVTPLLGHDTNSYDWFGWHAALGDGVVVVGAPGRTPQPGGPYGGVYVFRETGAGPMGGWSEEAVLYRSPGNGLASVAYAAIGSTELVAMGVPGVGPNVNNSWEYGAAYVFRRTGTGPMGGWALDAILQQAAPVSYDATGTALALAPLPGGALALAAFSRRDVLVFERTADGAWSETARLPLGASTYYAEPEDLAASASERGALVVALPGRVFRRGPGGWAQEATLVPADPGEGEFPDAVAVLGAGTAHGGDPLADDLVVVGAGPSDNAPGGSAYVFRFDPSAGGGGGAWAEEATLRPAVARPSFGRSVSLAVDHAGRALVFVSSSGPAVTVFRRDGVGAWSEVATVDLAPSGASSLLDGAWGGRAVTGWASYASNGTESGGAWILDVRSALATAAEGEPSPAGPLALAVAPNPARGVARLTVHLPEASSVTVRVVDVLGREVARPVAGALGAGAHAVTVDVSTLPPGVYVVRAAAVVGGRPASAAVRLTVVR